jgi:serine/threonine protein phosphatase 1
MTPTSQTAARTIAIGDVHGCSQALETLLEVIEPRKSDLIVALGDYVNRGPDSRAVLDRLISLESQCTLVAILGNHDEIFLQMLEDARAGRCRTRLGWLGMGGTSTLASYGAASGPTAGLDLAQVPVEHVEFLKRCGAYHETETHIFTHASYDSVLPIHDQPVDLLRWESLRDGIPGPHVSGKTVIVGHTSQKCGEILDLGHVVCIDTYCYGGGWLTAFNVLTGEIWQANLRGELRQPRSE